MPSQDFDVRYRKPDGTWEPLNVELSPLSYEREGPDTPPRGVMTVSFSAIANTNRWGKFVIACPQRHICSAMASRLRAQFPRLTTAQIDRLARVIRRKQGRPIASMRDLVKRLSHKELVQMGNRMWRGAK